MYVFLNIKCSFPMFLIIKHAVHHTNKNIFAFLVLYFASKHGEMLFIAPCKGNCAHGSETYLVL